MFEKQVCLPTPETLAEEFALTPQLSARKAERDKLVSDVICGLDGRLVVVVGPCSAHAFEPVLEYARRLGRLQEAVKDRLVLVPRVYTCKPRSRGVGYMGMSSQPDLGDKEDAVRGIRMARGLLLATLEESGLSAADEMLYPEEHAYLGDLLSYVAVGARSSEDQMHRLTASGIDVPVGFKNPMSGNIPALVGSVRAAQSPQVFKYRGYQVKTGGNRFAHAVLRGRVDEYGNDIPNYDDGTLTRFSEAAEGVAVLVDANHSNSGKNYRLQADVVRKVLRSRREHGFGFLKGFMIESFLEEGCQTENIVFGKSVTDPCLGWADTERLIYEIAENV